MEKSLVVPLRLSLVVTLGLQSKLDSETNMCGNSIKAMDQGRPLEGARVHYDFLLTTVK